MNQPYQLNGSTSTFLVETPTTVTQKAVLFLPGISGDVYSDRFKPLVKTCNAAGWSVALVNAWENTAAVEQKNLNTIYKDVAAVITTLHELGYTQIAGIGKSFGGAVLLTHPSRYISRKILWAPAIGLADTENEANIQYYLTHPLNDLESLLDLKIGPNFLDGMEIPTLIIHGTADENIPLANSEKMAKLLSNGRLTKIEGADHSYKTKKDEESVVESSVKFLTSDLIEISKPWKPLN